MCVCVYLRVSAAFCCCLLAVPTPTGLKPIDYAIRLKLDSSFLDLLDEAHVMDDHNTVSLAF